jgi:hypothetical protein
MTKEIKAYLVTRMKGSKKAELTNNGELEDS